MLSYQHSYHAGCFADVMKHALLTRILNYLIKKDKPLLYLDTHAGRGLYNLQHEHALKTHEAKAGILPLWENRTQLSPLFSNYLETINRVNSSNALNYYPGSPEIALQLLRQQDRLVFCELHPSEFDYLAQISFHGHQGYVTKEDGLKNLNALLPPIERRGLVFIDPSYERKIEYQEVTKAIKAAYKKSPTMTYCLWYPLIDNQLPPQFVNNLEAIAPTNYLRLEFYTHATTKGMTGSGLWIINPPYVLAEEGEKMLQELSKIIQSDSASYLVEQKTT